jgi:hypothetical protein
MVLITSDLLRREILRLMKWLFLSRHRCTDKPSYARTPTDLDKCLPFPPTGTAELSSEWPDQFTILLEMSHFVLPTWRLLSCLTKLHQSFQGRILVVGLTRLARIRPTCLALTARQSNRARDWRVPHILRAWHVSINNRHNYHVKE